MTTSAQRDQVLKRIGLKVVVVHSDDIPEQSKRFDVMHIGPAPEIVPGLAALLTCVLVTHACGASWGIPVRPIVRKRAALPGSAVWARAVSGSPRSVASFITEEGIVVPDHVRLSNQRSPAVRTGNSNSHVGGRTRIVPITTCPGSTASCPAEEVSAAFHLAGLARERRVTEGANNGHRSVQGVGLSCLCLLPSPSTCVRTKELFGTGRLQGAARNVAAALNAGNNKRICLVMRRQVSVATGIRTIDCVNALRDKVRSTVQAGMVNEDAPCSPLTCARAEAGSLGNIGEALVGLAAVGTDVRKHQGILSARDGQHVGRGASAETRVSTGNYSVQALMYYNRLRVIPQHKGEYPHDF
jgi:hypothetical protein